MDEQNGFSLDLEANFQAAIDHLISYKQRTQTEKINRYQADIEDITYLSSRRPH